MIRSWDRKCATFIKITEEESSNAHFVEKTSPMIKNLENVQVVGSFSTVLRSVSALIGSSTRLSVGNATTSKRRHCTKKLVGG
mmetsp:Transcript_20313/g.31769  ORF Transcript_20313/g.31769 Transcript_20313/m.31769 type:complete len:83 (-) Transcript_20313:453-701(-)